MVEMPVPATYEWACRTGGTLSPTQKSQARKVLRRQYAAWVAGLVRAPFRASGRQELPTAPDSRLATIAESAARSQSSALLGHGHRTWIIGAALAELDGRQIDRELLYVTSLLHDTGLMRTVIGEDFTVRSGGLLMEVCAEAAVPERGRPAADAAVAHASIGLRFDTDPVGFYVQAGAIADLVGLRMSDLPRGYLRQAYAAHPAAGVHVEVGKRLREESRAVPDGRFAVLHAARMDRFIAVSPTRWVGRSAAAA